MKTYRCLAISGAIIVTGFFILFMSPCWGLLYFFIVLLLELGSFFLVNYLKKDFQWLITPRDRYPVLDKKSLKRFIEHGYDPELGWVRKPYSEKTEITEHGKSYYHIQKNGSRLNPEHEGLPRIISCYGDSFIFARQVNDNETFAWHLSRMTGSNVLNFGVGNYGLDQAILRLKREYPSNRTDTVIMGVVPSTIVRLLSVWKHYNEFGNILGFKPRYILNNGKLKLIPNYIDNEKKFFRYQEFLPQINQYDEFYNTKFKNDMIQFPYFVSILADPIRNLPLLTLVTWDRWFSKKKKRPYPMPMSVIMRVNLKLRVDLFNRDNNAVELLEQLIMNFLNYGKKNSFNPIFMWMPQKDDIVFIKKRKNYYGAFIERIKRKIDTIDLTPYWTADKDLNRLYCDDSHYGGHHSVFGNRILADIIYKELRNKNIL